MDPTFDHQRHVVVFKQLSMLDGGHALLDRDSKARTPVRMRCHVAADAFGFLDGAGDLGAAVHAGSQGRSRRADTAGGEEFEVVGAMGEVLARAAAYLIDTVERRDGSPVAVAGRYAACRAQQSRASNGADVDRLPQVDVQEVLLGHRPQSGGPSRKIAPKVPDRTQDLARDGLTHLARLVAVSGHDRGMAVGIHQAGHHELVAEVHNWPAAPLGLFVRVRNVGDAVAFDNHDGVVNGRRAHAVEKCSTAQHNRHPHILPESTAHSF